MCDKAVNACFFVFNCVSDWHKTQELRDRFVSKDLFMLKFYNDRYQTQ